MANKFTYQILRDTNTDSVIKLTGVFDGSGQESNGARIAANTLLFALDANGAPLHTALSVSNTALSYYDIQVTGVKYYVNLPTSTIGSVEMYWNGAGATPSAQYANSATIAHLNSQGDFGNGEQLPSIPNNGSGGNGDIGIYTLGATANAAYTMIISIRKDNAQYQRGQLNDPAAFNYGAYKLTP